MQPCRGTDARGAPGSDPSSAPLAVTICTADCRPRGDGRPSSGGVAASMLVLSGPGLPGAAAATARLAVPCARCQMRRLMGASVCLRAATGPAERARLALSPSPDRATNTAHCRILGREPYPARLAAAMPRTVVSRSRLRVAPISVADEAHHECRSGH